MSDQRATNRLVILRFPGRCAKCAGSLARGEQAWLHRSTSALTCVACAAGGPGADLVIPGVAGANGRHRLARRPPGRERRIRDRFGRLGLAVGDRAAGQEPIPIQGRGTLGDPEVAVRLGRLLEGRHVLLLGDRRMPDARSEIDHIAVGPGGVTVIAARRCNGKVRGEMTGWIIGPRSERLLVDGRDRTRLIDKIELQVAAVSVALARLALERIDVRGAICFAGENRAPFRALNLRGVAIDGPDAIAALAAREGTLTEREVALIGELLAERFPPA
jgi:hypothetical protein